MKAFFVLFRLSTVSLTKDQYDLILDIFYDNILAPNPYENPKPSRTNRKSSRIFSAHSPVLQSKVSPRGTSRLWDTSSSSRGASRDMHSPSSSPRGSASKSAATSSHRPGAATLRNLRPRTGSFHKSATSPRQSLTRKQLSDLHSHNSREIHFARRPSLQRPFSTRSHSPRSDPSTHSRPRTLDRIKYSYTDFYGQLSSLNFTFKFGNLSLVCKHPDMDMSLPKLVEDDFAAVALSNLAVDYSRDQLQRSSTSVSVQVCRCPCRNE